MVFHRGDFNRAIARASAVDLFIEAIMEKVVSVAASRVAGANPNAAAYVGRGVLSPRHIVISRDV